MILGCQSYPWSQRHRHDAASLREALPDILRLLAGSGIETYEPCMPSAEDVAVLRAAGEETGVRVVSVYLGARLHQEDAEEQVEGVAEAARGLAALGAEAIVCNPDPIAWGKPLEKSDEELDRQAAALRALGGRLAEQGQRLAYHVHDTEMQSEGRELHRMMAEVEPQRMGLCFDPHWVFRGAGDSADAAYGVANRYADRVVNVHVRQSVGGVWTEGLQEGDLDYVRLLGPLKRAGFDGLLCLEMIPEAGTPETMPLLDSHRRSAQWLREAWAAA